MVTADDVRRIALSLPRAYEVLVRDRVKFRVGRLVFLSLSRDETAMGFAFAKEQRASLIAAEPEKFFMPLKSDERYHWVRAWLDQLDLVELEELVVEAWCFAVPKGVAAAYFEGRPVTPPPPRAARRPPPPRGPR